MFEDLVQHRHDIAVNIVGAFEKARYVDNPVNRKLGRVGQSYGAEKREKDALKVKPLGKQLSPDSKEYAERVERVVRDFMSSFKKDATEKEIKEAINKIITSSKKQKSTYSKREIQEKIYFGE